MLDFRMETFLAVCRYMNYTKASEHLNITQPAVSQHIRYLEKYYQAKLFRYEGKKLKLTEAGEILRSASLTMMHDEMTIRDEMRHPKEERELNFGATKTVGDAVMGELLREYLAEYPDAKIRMTVENTQALLEMLDKGRIDFALVEGFFKKNEYDSQKFSQERYIAVCSPDYLSGKCPTKVEDVFGERILLREEGSGTREVLERFLDSQNYELEDFGKQMEVGSLHAIKELAKAGCGITFLYEVAVCRELEEGSLIPIPLEGFPLYHEFMFIWRRGSIFAEYYNELFERLSQRRKV